MSKLEFAKGTYSRQVARTPIIPQHNRFVESVPTLTDGPVSAIARPALKFLSNLGTGPIRGIHTAPGIFGNKAFVVNGNDLNTVDPQDGAQTLVATISTNPVGDVSWAPVAQISESVPSRLFFAEGRVLWVYNENAEAVGLLQSSAIANGDQVEINGVYYEFTNASVDAGTPAGTSGDPWLVALGGDLAITTRNLFYAINANEGTAGTDYSTATTAHPTVRAYAYSGGDLFVAAIDVGTVGNSYSTTETGANMAWGAATLTGGGTTRVRQVNVPGDVGAISVTSINSYVIVIPVQSEELNTVGKFYWIEPGDDFIDPLNFASAERSSDLINQTLTFRDQYWLFGSETIEAWITTGDPEAPMQRYSGVLVDRGSWEGTAVRVRDSMIFVDDQGGVFRVAGGGAERISRPDIEERIRRGIQQQLKLTI
jgi:hypothetical protein